MPHTRRTYILIALALTLLILIGTGLYFFVYKKEGNLHNPLVVFSLRGIGVGEDFSEVIHPSHLGTTGITSFSVPLTGSSTLADYASLGNVTVSVQRDSDTQNEQIVQLAPTEKTLKTLDGEKAGLTISPDGHFIAYAVATSTRVHALEDSKWEIHVQNLSTNTDVSFGQGFDPQFFTRDGKQWMLYVSKQGLSLVAMADLTKTYVTPFTTTRYVISGLKVSPQGTVLAIRDAARMKYSLFKIESVGTTVPLTLTPLSVDISYVASLFFVDEDTLLVTEVEPNATTGNRSISELHLSTAARKQLYTYEGINSVRFISTK